GRKYTQTKHGKEYGPKFSLGDTVGCGIHYTKKEVFFTKNGKYLGCAFYNVCKKLYPTIGLHSYGERVTANFGSLPFKFDIQQMLEVFVFFKRILNFIYRKRKQKRLNK